MTKFFVLLTIISLSVAAISCQPSAEDRPPSSAASPEDPLTGEKHMTELDDFIGSGGTVRPGLGFHVESKRWVAYVEVRVVP
jgi:hypothetical protein